MMNEYAYFEKRFTVNALGKIEQVNFELIGNKKYILVSNPDGDFEPKNNTLMIGGYKLLILEKRWDIDGWLCVRYDDFAIVRLFTHRAARWLDWVYRRAIVVLAVFELADFHMAVIPSWRDIHALKWLAKVVK